MKERRKQVADEQYSSASVAQPDSEHLAFNQTCAGSNPAGGTEPVFLQLDISEEERRYWEWLAQKEEKFREEVYQSFKVPVEYLRL